MGEALPLPKGKMRVIYFLRLQQRNLVNVFRVCLVLSASPPAPVLPSCSMMVFPLRWGSLTGASCWSGVSMNTEDLEAHRADGCGTHLLCPWFECLLHQLAANSKACSLEPGEMEELRAATRASKRWGEGSAELWVTSGRRCQHSQCSWESSLGTSLLTVVNTNLLLRVSMCTHTSLPPQLPTISVNEKVCQSKNI